MASRQTPLKCFQFLSTAPCFGTTNSEKGSGTLASAEASDATDELCGEAGPGGAQGCHLGRTEAPGGL